MIASFLNKRKRIYWTAEIYGFGKWIRKYGYYPDSFPLCIYTDHGAGCNDDLPSKHELESDAPSQFYHCADTVKRFKSLSKKPCYVLKSPFSFARKEMGIEQSPSCSGTLFFLAHSTNAVSDLKSVEDYDKELKSIPESFMPLTICLHMHDVNKGLDKIYRDLGYHVVSAGDTLDENFTERFYNILANYKYTMSNIIGAYTYYSIEMKIPFSLFGEPPHYFNEGDSNIESGHYTSIFRTPHYVTARRLFSGFHYAITDEQEEFAHEGLGTHAGVSRLKMSFILYRSLLVWLFRKENYQPILNKVFFKKNKNA